MIDKEEQKRLNREAVLESYNLSKRQHKKLGTKKKKGKVTIKKIKRVDW